MVQVATGPWLLPVAKLSRGQQQKENAMASGSARVVRGSFLGTGALLEVRSVGFRPRSLKLINTDGLAEAEWLEGMADGAMAKRVTAGTMTAPTTGGITPLSDGFSIGTDADMNAVGERVHFEAIE